MAKKRKKSKVRRLAGIRFPNKLVETALTAANTRLGRVLIAEALIVAAGLLVRKGPVATAAAIGAEATDATRAATGATSDAVSATKTMAGFAGAAAVTLMHAAAERLRAGAGLAGHERKAGGHRAGKHASGSNGKRWDDLAEGTIRQALVGEFSSKKKGRKAKHARRH